MGTFALLLIIAVIIIDYFSIYQDGVSKEEFRDPDENFLQPPLNHITWEDKQDYLNSPKWKYLRQKILIRDGFSCTSCNSAENLEVHHITYDNWRQEKLEDLTTLCRNCHEQKHQETGFSYNKTH